MTMYAVQHALAANVYATAHHETWPPTRYMQLAFDGQGFWLYDSSRDRNGERFQPSSPEYERGWEVAA